MGSRTEPRAAAARERMVDRQVAGRGVRDAAVLEAMRTVPRERFVPPDFERFAYEDRPLPIGAGQTISQPYIVAFMAEAAELKPTDRVLEVGAGSGYAAAVLSRVAAKVYTVERHATLAREAERRFRQTGYDNIEVAIRDGSLGWPEHAPYDAIIVAAGSPDEVPRALKEQLARDGRLVIPRGRSLAGQELVRIRRSQNGEAYTEEGLGDVRFVPLVGAAGWSPGQHGASPAATATLPALMAGSAEPFDDLEDAPLDALLQRVGDARLVLLGEASHGTSQFYRMRARITRHLIEQKGFDFVAIEADWPDAAEIDAWVRHSPAERPHHKPFQRFPRWMWANTDVLDFARWLRAFDDAAAGSDPSRMCGFHGLDLYSMYASIEAVVGYLTDVDPRAADVARGQYACLSPWQDDPMLYGRAVQSGVFAECEGAVLAILQHLLARRMEYVSRDGPRFFDAMQNARLVANAEKYYRTLYRGAVSSWNLRDRHMFDTLQALLTAYGPGSRGVVWAHNSHLGDASATAMRERGEHNVGQVARAEYGRDAFLVGFGTHAGTVAAAHDWDEPMQVMEVRPSHPRSYERLAHDTTDPSAPVSQPERPCAL